MMTHLYCSLCFASVHFHIWILHDPPAFQAAKMGNLNFKTTDWERDDTRVKAKVTGPKCKEIFDANNVKGAKKLLKPKGPWDPNSFG